MLPCCFGGWARVCVLNLHRTFMSHAVCDLLTFFDNIGQLRKIAIQVSAYSCWQIVIPAVPGRRVPNRPIELVRCFYISIFLSDLMFITCEFHICIYLSRTICHHLQLYFNGGGVIICDCWNFAKSPLKDQKSINLKKRHIFPLRNWIEFISFDVSDNFTDLYGIIDQNFFSCYQFIEEKPSRCSSIASSMTSLLWEDF